MVAWQAWATYRSNKTKAADGMTEKPPPTILYRRVCNKKAKAAAAGVAGVAGASGTVAVAGEETDSSTRSFCWVQANLHSVTKGSDGTL